MQDPHFDDEGVEALIFVEEERALLLLSRHYPVLVLAPPLHLLSIDKPHENMLKY